MKIDPSDIELRYIVRNSTELVCLEKALGSLPIRLELSDFVGKERPKIFVAHDKEWNEIILVHPYNCKIKSIKAVGIDYEENNESFEVNGESIVTIFKDMDIKENLKGIN